MNEFRREHGDNKFKVLSRFMYKWLWCSWLHNRKKMGDPRQRCYPRVDIPKGEPGSDDWHCTLCHPCGEVFDYMMDDKQYGWF